MKRIVGWIAGSAVALAGLHTALALFPGSLDLRVYAQQPPAAPAIRWSGRFTHANG